MTPCQESFNGLGPRRFRSYFSFVNFSSLSFFSLFFLSFFPLVSRLVAFQLRWRPCLPPFCVFKCKNSKKKSIYVRERRPWKPFAARENKCEDARNIISSICFLPPFLYSLRFFPFYHSSLLIPPEEVPRYKVTFPAYSNGSAACPCLPYPLITFFCLLRSQSGQLVD